MEKYSTIADSNHNQIQALLAQNSKIESFLESATTIISENQEKTLEFNKKFYEFEQNFQIYKKELQDLTSDFETRYQYFYESAQSDISNIMKSQKDSNLSLEKFIDLIDERVQNFENSIEKRIEESELRFKELREESGGSGGSFDIEKFQNRIHKFRQEINKNSEKIKEINGKIVNFRNEVNNMILDFETESQRKFERLENGVESISRQTGIRNPLI